MTVASKNYKAVQQQWFQQVHPEVAWLQQKIKQMPEDKGWIKLPETQMEWFKLMENHPEWIEEFNEWKKENISQQTLTQRNITKLQEEQSLSQRATQAKKASDVQEKSKDVQVRVSQVRE